MTDTLFIDICDLPLAPEEDFQAQWLICDAKGHSIVRSREGVALHQLSGALPPRQT